MKDLSRRQLILSGLGLVVAGCSGSRYMTTPRPGPLWPTLHDRPHIDDRPVTTLPNDAGATAVGPIMAYPRARWAKARPILRRLRVMGRIQRITIHHEGWTPVWFNDPTSTSKRLEAIRTSHLKRLCAGDIGYHLIIDRAGQIWQGRDLQYQGAHVRDQNKNNVGVMVLGNFDLQRPTDLQLTALHQTVTKLMHQYDIPIKQVFTHQEFNITSCPGKSLQRNMVAMRRGGKWHAARTI